jgi:translocation and assembly module TamA
LFATCAWLVALEVAAQDHPIDAQASGVLQSSDTPLVVQGGVSEAAVTPTRRPPPTWVLDVQAPPPLDALLLQYLDLGRFQAQVQQAVGLLTTEVQGDTEGSSPSSAGEGTISRSELRRLVAAAPDQARALLEAEGHFNAEVRVAMAEEVPGQPIRITMLVDPGPRATVNRLQLVFEGDLDNRLGRDDAAAIALSERLAREFVLAEGSTFRQALWSQAKVSAQATLRAEGYAAASWSGTSATVDAQASTAKLFLVADSGPLFHFGPIAVEGLVRQPESAVRNSAYFQPGEPYRERQLLDFQERLQKLNLFDYVQVALEEDPAQAASAPVRVQVKESKLQQATLGIGVSSDTGPRGSVEHQHRLLWGYPLQARSKLQLGRDESLVQSDLTAHPRPGGRRWLGAVAFSRLIDDDEVVTYNGRVRFGESDDGERMEKLAYLEWQRSRVVDAQGDLLSDASALTGMRQWLWKDVDSVVLPTRGLTFNGSLGVGHSFATLDSSGPFGRAYGRLNWYRPLPARWYLSVRQELGQVLARERVDVPDALLFRAGGDESVRGYGYRSLGEVVDGVTLGGRVLATSSVEASHPLLDRLPALWGALFVDVGDAALNWKQWEPAWGYGAGVRWRSPVGPLRLDVARAARTGEYRLHFSVGIAL